MESRDLIAGEGEQAGAGGGGAEARRPPPGARNARNFRRARCPCRSLRLSPPSTTVSLVSGLILPQPRRLPLPPGQRTSQRPPLRTGVCAARP